MFKESIGCSFWTYFCSQFRLVLLCSIVLVFDTRDNIFNVAPLTSSSGTYIPSRMMKMLHKTVGGLASRFCCSTDPDFLSNCCLGQNLILLSITWFSLWPGIRYAYRWWSVSYYWRPTLSWRTDWLSSTRRSFWQIHPKGSTWSRWRGGCLGNEWGCLGVLEKFWLRLDYINLPVVSFNFQINYLFME